MAQLDAPAVHGDGAPSLAETQAHPLHLAIGMFDGVHLGHQLVISQAVEQARSMEGHRSGVLTFDPHPSRLLYPARATPLLMPLSQRIGHMRAAGADFVFIQPFTAAYARHKAEDFVAGLKQLFPRLQSLHVGENFRFGAGRAGDVELLRRCAARAGVTVHSLQRKAFNGGAISSSRIRAALAHGDIGLANAMLGHLYVVQGPVIEGRRVGRALGFPTLNIAWNPEAAPCFGVYRVLVRWPGAAAPLHGVANYGLHPTVGGSRHPLLEVHLLDPTQLPATGDEVRVALLEFFREERLFPDVAALQAQIARDVQRARAAWNEAPAGDRLPF